MRDVLEAILTHSTKVDPKSLAEIRRYTTLFWINTGPYNNLTARKFVLNLTPQALADAARAAAGAGATFPTAPGESLDQLLDETRSDVLRPEREAVEDQSQSRPRRGHPHGEQQQPLSRRDD